MKTIKIFLIGILVLSCKDKREEVNVNDGLIYQYDKTNIIFPDTVYKKTIIEGIIDYNFEEYNLLRSSIGSGKVSRFIHFYPYLAKNIIDNEKGFVIRDTFYTQNVNLINFNVKFDSVGVYYLNGIIKDMVIFDTINDNKNKASTMPAKFSYVLINKKVVVVDDK